MTLYLALFLLGLMVGVTCGAAAERSEWRHAARTCHTYFSGVRRYRVFETEVQASIDEIIAARELERTIDSKKGSSGHG